MICLVVSNFISNFATDKICIMARSRKIKIDNSTKRELYDKFSDYTLDLSKLVFGGVILAGVMGLSVNPNILFGLGTVSVIILSILGFTFIVLKHNSRR